MSQWVSPSYIVYTLQVALLHLGTWFLVCRQVMTMSGSLLKMKTLPLKLGVTQGSWPPRLPIICIVITPQVAIVHLGTSFLVCRQVMTMSGSLLKMKTLPLKLGVTQGSWPLRLPIICIVITPQVAILHIGTSFLVCRQVMTMSGSLLKMKSLPL